MRSTLDIIIAVQDCQEVSHEELRLALMAFSGINHFIKNDLDKLIKSIEEDQPPSLIKLNVEFAKQTRERMFRAMKLDPAAWLGPFGIPGTPEHAERQKIAKSIARAAGVL